MFGCRVVGMFGGFLAGFSLALSPLSRDIHYVCLMFGVLSGKTFSYFISSRYNLFLQDITLYV